MFILDETRSRALEAELRPLFDAGESLEVIAAVLGRHARMDLVRGVVNFGLRPYASALDEGVLFRDGLVTLVNGPLYALDLRYGFEMRGEDMLPSGRAGALLARSSDVVIANIGPERLPYTRYVVRDAPDFSCFHPNATLERSGDELLRPGEALIVRGGSEIVSLRHVAGARFLSLCAAPRWAIDWVFDRETLRPMAQSVAHVDDSQLITCLEVAAWLKSDMLLESVATLTSHSAHFVRWKAIQSLASLDNETAVRCVHAAATDGHPAIRAAAQRTLASLDTAAA